MFRRIGFGLFSRLSAGLPRSQARLSKSPKMWHEAQEASPLLDRSVESESTERPFCTIAGSGLKTGRWATSVAVAVLMTETELSKRGEAERGVRRASPAQPPRAAPAH